MPTFSRQGLSLRTLFLLALAGCDADEPALGDPDYPRDPALDVSLISAHDEQRSHESGDNCMRCHQERGPGPGRFTAAGTVHDGAGEPLANGVVELRTGPGGGGDLVLAVEVDGLGNFYTTEALPLPDTQLFPTVYGPGGGYVGMPFPTASAACNVCHVGSAVIRAPGA